jgi:uncharacterized protein
LGYKTKGLYIGGKKLKADIADTVSKRGKGLSGRKTPEKNSCMLFIFSYLGKHTLWMRGMNFPIDVLWLDEERNITDIKTNIQPAKNFFDFSTYSPNHEAKYVIELPSGFVKKNKVKTSTQVKF